MDSKNQNERFSFEKLKNIELSLILNVLFYIIGIILLTTIILRIPNIERYFTVSEFNNYDGDNFFFRWYYSISHNYSDYTFSLREIQPSYGFYIFLPIISILFLVVGSGFIVCNPENMKKLFFTTWILNLIPLIAYIVIASAIRSDESFLSINMEYYLPTLGFYPIFSILPIQLMQIFTNESFHNLIKYNKDENNIEIRLPKKIKPLSVVIVLFTLITSIMFPYLLLSEKLLDGENFWIFLIIITTINFYLLILVFTFARKQDIRRYTKELLAFFIPLFSFWLFLAIIAFLLPSYSGLQDIIFYLFQTISFPRVMQALLIKWALALIFSFPIGFYSKRKMFFVFTAIYTVVHFSLIYIFNLPELIYLPGNFTIGEKIYLIVDPIILGIILVLGAFIGRLFGRDFWKDHNIKQAA